MSTGGGVKEISVGGMLDSVDRMGHSPWIMVGGNVALLGQER